MKISKRARARAIVDVGYVYRGTLNRWNPPERPPKNFFSDRRLVWHRDPSTAAYVRTVHHCANEDVELSLWILQSYFYELDSGSSIDSIKRLPSQESAFSFYEWRNVVVISISILRIIILAARFHWGRV